ncbi:hypothetical protein E4T44_01167 [Aureobasidium sp. EXF-8845]|nr:hypothetical protein E4T44_01167 [Aureobasidium sp. EXF-8845]KAI4857385.1 hypothetical protein E4T45_01126 [Aureobasidium sp. EXF-8846]
MSDPEDYTVGWICAVDTEYTAAQKFFDKKHARLGRRAANDTNHYTLGEINGHNVVMAVLPHGEYGTNSAASVVANMRNSFPKIQFGLMVGIGGGAPNDKHDIRLGDIVVSSPKDGSPGVYHYDFGKTIQDSPFAHTGFLNPPPREVRSAINGLSSKYSGEGHHIDGTTTSILQTWPLLEEDFSRPARESDRLFASDFVHTSTDARIRNGDAKEKDILCFEMEAAGIMNDLPCLIIRGMCDYSDSHKSKDWQGYAAMTAAAYAKDLLGEIQRDHTVQTIATKAQSVENKTRPGDSNKSDDGSRHGPRFSTANGGPFGHRVFEQVFAQPKFIALFGMEGSGMCVFISKLGGRKISNGRALVLEEKTVDLYNVSFEGQEIILVGMPERYFGYPDLGDTNLLRLIVGFLKEIYEHDILLSGIIYFHQMNHRCLKGTSLRTFNIFQRLCGDNALKNIVLATSLWDWIFMEEECNVNFVEQEQELISNLWSRMITGGSRVRRYWCDRNTAEQILREVVQHTPVALGIQHELVDEHKRLVDTVAGSYVHEGLKQLHQGYQEELNQCFETLQTSIGEARQDAQRKYEGILKKMNTNKEEIRMLHEQ